MNTTSNSTTDCSAQQELQTLETAILAILASIKPVIQTETLPILEAHNRILAQDLEARVNVPPTDNSAVDGYALNSEQMPPEHCLPVSQRIPAGRVPETLKAGTAARIFTGASIPRGADCVVMQEQCEREGNKVRIPSNISVGQNIRPKGQDLQVGQTILRKGEVLRPQAIGLAASSGYASLKVFAPLTLAILSTGDELCEPGDVLGEGQIYNSNRYLLQALLNSFGCKVLDLGVIPDKLDATSAALEHAAQNADLILTTGGASVGEEDHVKAAIEAMGSLSLWRLALKPGKPFMFGRINETPVLGLPGNPGAVLVTFSLLARPALLKRMGCRHTKVISERRTLAFSPGSNGKRREFKRVQCQSNGSLILHPNQSSGMLSSACWADGLAVIPEYSELKAGDSVEYYSFNSLMNLPYQGSEP